MVAVGVDGCKTGWIAVARRDDAADEPVAVFHLPTIGALLDRIPDAAVVAIDIPIGLPTSGHRPADVQARAFLGARRSSVFFTPVRAAVEATTHRAATAASVELTRMGVSAQAYALARKILEVEAWLPEVPSRRQVHEAHPEVCFAHLLGAPAAAGKKTWAGMVERRAALARVGMALDDVDPDVGRQAAVDDVLDAAIAAWTAGRILRGEARTFPDPPEVDPITGRPVAIWA